MGKLFYILGSIYLQSLCIAHFAQRSKFIILASKAESSIQTTLNIQRVLARLTQISVNLLSLGGYMMGALRQICFYFLKYPKLRTFVIFYQIGFLKKRLQSQTLLSQQKLILKLITSIDKINYKLLPTSTICLLPWVKDEQQSN